MNGRQLLHFFPGAAGCLLQYCNPLTDFAATDVGENGAAQLEASLLAAGHRLLRRPGVLLFDFIVPHHHSCQ